jgi:hypothetical protein
MQEQNDTFSSDLMTAKEMNVEAREQLDSKEEFIKEHATTLKDDDLTTYPKPSKSCRKCFKGRGYTGWDLDGNVILCSCVTNRKEEDESRLMTVGELKAITSTPAPPRIEKHIRPKSLRRAVSPILKKSRKWRKHNEMVSKNLKTLYQEVIKAYTRQRFDENGTSNILEQ